MSRDLRAADRLGMEDALLRLAAGADEGDAALIASAFTPLAVVDFGPCGDKLGLPFPPLVGRDAVVGFLTCTSVRQVTSHVVTNVRVEPAPAGAKARALVQATHIARDEPDRPFRMLGVYTVDLAREGDDWRIAHLVIDNIWFEGDPQTLLHR